MPVRCPTPRLAEQWLCDAGVAEAGKWLALAGGSPLLALELSGSGEQALLDTLLTQVAGARTLDPLAAAVKLDTMVKADKRPAPLKRVIDWAQKWLFDLTLASQGLPPRYFLAQAPALMALAQATDTDKLLAFNRKAIQYRAQCEQPLNSRLFLEDFFLSYTRLFRTS